MSLIGDVNSIHFDILSSLKTSVPYLLNMCYLTVMKMRNFTKFTFTGALSLMIAGSYSKGSLASEFNDSAFLIGCVVNSKFTDYKPTLDAIRRLSKADLIATHTPSHLRRLVIDVTPRTARFYNRGQLLKTIGDGSPSGPAGGKWTRKNSRIEAELMKSVHHPQVASVKEVGEGLQIILEGEGPEYDNPTPRNYGNQIGIEAEGIPKYKLTLLINSKSPERSTLRISEYIYYTSSCGGGLSTYSSDEIPMVCSAGSALDRMREGDKHELTACQMEYQEAVNLSEAVGREASNMGLLPNTQEIGSIVAKTVAPKFKELQEKLLIDSNICKNPVLKSNISARDGNIAEIDTAISWMCPENLLRKEIVFTKDRWKGWDLMTVSVCDSVINDNSQYGLITEVLTKLWPETEKAPKIIGASRCASFQFPYSDPSKRETYESGLIAQWVSPIILLDENASRQPFNATAEERYQSRVVHHPSISGPNLLFNSFVLQSCLKDVDFTKYKTPSTWIW